MKEKRYYCDLFMGEVTSKETQIVYHVVAFMIVIGFLVGAIYYNVFMQYHKDDLEAYSESAYERLYDIADNAIKSDGIDTTYILDNVDKYEITYEDDEIIFKYSIDNNKDKKYATPAEMTITLSKDYKVISKVPNYYSKEDYVKKHKSMPIVAGIIIGIATFVILFCLSYLTILIVIGGVRIDIWTHLMRGCIIDYVH